MTSKRRRWLTALGLFLATAIGGVVAFLLARRRMRKSASPEEIPVTELSARLRREAARQERRVRRRPGGFGHGLGRRRGHRAAVEAVAEEEKAEMPPAPVSGEGHAAEESPRPAEDGGSSGEK